MALLEKAYAENRMSKWKTKYKTGATRYTRKSYVEEYLKNPVLGSAPCTVSWVVALGFDPTSLSGSWNVTPAANEKKQKEKEKNRQKHRDREREPETRAQERNPIRASQDRQETRHQGHFIFSFFVSDGCGVGALCSVLVYLMSSQLGFFCAR